MPVNQPNSPRQRVLYHPCLRWGGVLGILMATTAVAWVFVANRMPALERFALDRNLAAAAALTLLMLVPLLRFLRTPGHIFLSGIIGWTMLAAAYRILEGLFPLLGQRLGAFHLFILGATLLGIASTTVWVARLILQTRQQAMGVARR